MKSLTLSFLAFALLSCYQAAHFSTSSPDDGDILYVCVGDTLVLPWTLRLTTGDVITNIKWFFTDSTNNKELIALSSNGVILTVSAYSGRLHNANETTLTLSHVTTENAGNFSVKVDVRDNSTDVITLERSVQVEVGDGLQTSDGYLHVTYPPTATQDKSGQWAVHILCGTFTYLSTPPFHVQWQLPSGSLVKGDNYTNGQFTLQLHAPVQGGNYTCRIPPESTAPACLNGTEMKGEATLHLDGVEVRLLLLEAHQAALQKENDVLKMENSQLKANASAQQASITHNQASIGQNQASIGQNQASIGQNQASIGQQQQKTSALNTSFTQLKEKKNRQVSFAAYHLQTDTLNMGDTLIFPTITTNQGNAYNTTTGVFTAPFSGNYFFAATAGSKEKGKNAAICLVKEGTQVSCGEVTPPESKWETTSTQAVVRLQVGQRVWVKARHTSSVSLTDTQWATFSGFLLNSD